MLQGLYAWALIRGKREVDNDFSFVRQTNAFAFEPLIDAICTFPREEQYQIVAAMIRVANQELLSLWGGKISADDLQLTRACGERVDRTLRKMPPVHTTKAADVKAVPLVKTLVGLF